VEAFIQSNSSERGGRHARTRLLPLPFEAFPRGWRSRAFLVAEEQGVFGGTPPHQAPKGVGRSATKALLLALARCFV
jgi:hypothetical protein